MTSKHMKKPFTCLGQTVSFKQNKNKIKNILFPLQKKKSIGFVRSFYPTTEPDPK